MRCCADSRRRLSTVACAVALIVSAGAVFPAEVAPHTLNPSAPRPVSSIIALPGGGDEVVLRGRIREKTASATYAIADESGRINVRIADTLLTCGIALTPGTPVEVHGRIEFMPGRAVQVEAHKVIVLRAAQAPFGSGNVEIR